jgi:hypothetical protein
MATDIDIKALMLDIQGKAYLPVAARVLWARGEHPDWSIVTEHVDIAGKTYMRATVATDGSILATAHKLIDPERRGPGARYPVESAETGAIGRALGLCGYGTLAGDLDEGDELADTPVPHGVKHNGRTIAAEDAPKPKRGTGRKMTDAQLIEAAGPVDDAPWPGEEAGWREVIEAADDPSELLALLSRVDDEPQPYRRNAALLIWAKALADLGTPEDIKEAGAAVKAWPADKPSRMAVLGILGPAYKAATAKVDAAVPA